MSKKSKGIPGLKKSVVWWAGLIVLAAFGIIAIYKMMSDVAQSVVWSVVWLVGLGLGAQVADSVQKAIWFREELHEKKDENKGQ